MSNPYYSPTQEEISAAARSAKRKFSNRFVSMNTYADALEKLAMAEEAIQKIRQVASGELQIAMDDTVGMEWIDKYAQQVIAKLQNGASQ